MKNIQQCISDLKERNISEQEIVRMLKEDFDYDCSQPTINRISRGAQPKYNLGVMLIALHKKVMRRKNHSTK